MQCANLQGDRQGREVAEPASCLKAAKAHFLQIRSCMSQKTPFHAGRHALPVHCVGMMLWSKVTSSSSSPPTLPRQRQPLLLRVLSWRLASSAPSWTWGPARLVPLWLRQQRPPQLLVMLPPALPLPFCWEPFCCWPSLALRLAADPHPPHRLQHRHLHHQERHLHLEYCVEDQWPCRQMCSSSLTTRNGMGKVSRSMHYCKIPSTGIRTLSTTRLVQQVSVSRDAQPRCSGQLTPRSHDPKTCSAI